MSPSSFQELVDDIRENGLRKNILLSSDGTVLIDGRSRLRACGVAGVEPRFNYLPKDTTKAEVLRLMVSANVKTRKLKPGQLAMIGHAYLQEIKDLPREDFKNYPVPRKYDTTTPRGLAAVVMGVSSKTIWQAGVILRFSAEVAQGVREGTIRLNTAYEQVMKDRGLRTEGKPIITDAPLPKFIPKAQDNSRGAVDARRLWLKHFAGQNMDAAEISRKINISEEHVRRLARRYQIQLPGDAWSYKRRKPTFDVNRIAQVIADDLVAMSDSFPRIRDNLDHIDPNRAEEWAKIYMRSSRYLSQLARSLQQLSMTNGNIEDNHDSA